MEDPRLASSRLHADVDRLGAQAALSWPHEIAVLERLGLRDAMAILEVGSGPGFITERLLQLLPNAHLTAVELDPLMVASACQRLRPYILDGRLEIIETSILQTDLPSDAFDFALVRLVMQHLSAPDFALIEIQRLLKPSGTIAVVDVDDALGGLLTPRLPAFELLADRIRQIQARNAGDREIGRKLWRLLTSTGFAEVGLEIVTVNSDELGIEAFLPQYHPDRYRSMVRPGGLTEAELTRYQADYEAFVRAPDALILQLLMLAYGRKPAA